MKSPSQTHYSDIDLEHHLQRSILNKFLHKDSCTYSELLIDGMSGNSFLYHLKALLRLGLIQKTDNHTYEITDTGRLAMDSLDYETSKFRVRPTNGIYVWATSKTGEVMLYKSARQPLLNKVGMVYGKISMGQSPLEVLDYVTSRRGLSGIRILDARALNIVYRRDGNILSHRCGPLYIIEVDSPQPARITTAGETYWIKLGEKLEDAMLPEVSRALLNTSEIIINIDVEI